MCDIGIWQNSVHSACIAYNINKKSSTSIRDTALFVYYKYLAMDYKIKRVIGQKMCVKTAINSVNCWGYCGLNLFKATLQIDKKCCY